MSSLDDKYNNMTLKEAVEAYQKEEKEKQIQETKSHEEVQQYQNQNKEDIGRQKEFTNSDLKSPDNKNLTGDTKEIPNTKKVPDTKKISDIEVPDIKIPDIKLSDIKIPDLRISDTKINDIKILDERAFNSGSANAEIADNTKKSNERALSSKTADTKNLDKREFDSKADSKKSRKKMSGFEKFAEVGKWFQTICWIKIPIIGFLYILVLAVSKRTPPDKKYFVLGYLMYKILVWTLALVLIYCLYNIGLNFIDDMLSFVKG